MFQARQLLLQQLQEYPVTSAWSPSGTHLAVATADGCIHLFAMTRGSPPQSWQAHATPVQKLCWHPREPLLSSAGQDARVRHWAIDSGTAPVLLAEVPQPQDWIEDMAWRPDGQLLAVAAGRTTSVYERSGKLASTMDFAVSTIAALAWSPRGTELALAGYQGIQLFREVGRKPQATRLFWQGSLLTCCWSPDGKIIAACSQDNSLHFWRVKSLRDAQMSGFPAKPRAMAFTPDSRYLVTGGSESLTAWDFSGSGPEGTAPVELHYHQEIVSTLSIDPVTGHVAAGSKDGVVSLWLNAVATHPYYHFRMSAPLVALHWQHVDGLQLLTALDEAGHVGVWELYPG